MCVYQSVECAFTSPVSIESGMLVTCRMQYEMSVSTVLQCGDVVSLGRKYVFATVMSLVLPMCILISCSYVSCVDGFGYIYVCKGYVVLGQYDEPPSLVVLSVCAYGGVFLVF